MCTPRSFSQDDWKIEMQQMEMSRGSEMFARLFYVPRSITLVLSGCIAILFSDAQIVTLSAPVCSCVLTELMEDPELVKVVSSIYIQEVDSVFTSGMSLINRMKIMGPRDDPCRTPLRTGRRSDVECPIETN